MKKNARKGSRIHSNYSPAISNSCTRKYKHKYEFEYEYKYNATGKNDIQTQTSNLGTKEALLNPTLFKGQKYPQMSIQSPPLYTPTPTPARDSYRHAHADDASINSFASAPMPAMIRSPLPTPMLKMDGLHSNKAGTTIPSGPIVMQKQTRSG